MKKEVELLKSNTILFTGIGLVKKSLSNWLVEEILDIDEKCEKEPIIRAKLDSKGDIKKLREFLDREIKQQDDGLYESCIEELKEIKDDLNWESSKDGKFIQKLEEWVLATRTNASLLGWESIFIGRSIINPKGLNIGGLVRNEKEAEEIKKQIDLWAPPVPPRYLLQAE